jgi:hypothetical protein
MFLGTRSFSSKLASLSFADKRVSKDDPDFGHLLETIERIIALDASKLLAYWPGLLMAAPSFVSGLDTMQKGREHFYGYMHVSEFIAQSLK